MLFILDWEGKAGEQTDLRKEKLCDRRTCVDFMVVVRAFPFFCQLYSELYYLMRFLKRFPVYDDRIYYFARIEALPKGMNFWRCFTHWIGGMECSFVMMITSLDTDNSVSLMR